MIAFGRNFIPALVKYNSTSVFLSDFAAQAGKDRMMTPHTQEISSALEKMFPGCLNLRPVRTEDFEAFQSGWAKDFYREKMFENTIS